MVAIAQSRSRYQPEPLPRLPALVYCRVSTAKQEEEGTSLDSQAEAGMRHAEELGYTIGRVTKETYTGSELWDRPLLSRDRADLKAGQFSALVAYSTDRLSRDPIHLMLIAEECEHAGVELIFVTEPLDASPEGKLIQYVKGYASSLEREKIRERTLRGKRTRLLGGKIHGNAPELYGYRRDKAAGVRLVVEPEAGVVRLIFTWIADDGLSLHQVVKRLNERGIAPPSAGKLTYPDPSRAPKWGRTQVTRILDNPSYKGETVQWRWRRSASGGPVLRPKAEHVTLPAGVTPAIVSPEVWQRAHERLATQTGAETRNETHPYLLRGALVCGTCGRAMRPMMENNRTTHARRVYRCSSRETPDGACGGKRIPAEPCEEWVWDSVNAVLEHPEVVAAQLEQVRAQGPDPVLTADLETARRELARREKQQERLLRNFSVTDDEDGDEEGVPAGLVKREIARLEREKAGYQATVRDLEARIAQQQLAVEQLESVMTYCKRVRSELPTFTFAERRKTLVALDIHVSGNGRDWKLWGAIPIPQRAEDGTELAPTQALTSAVRGGTVESNISTLCPPLAATSSARLTCSCPRTSDRS